MNVIHVITGLGDGGAEGALYRLVSCDTAAQHHVVSLMGRGKYAAMLEAAGISVTCLDMPRGRLTLGGLWRLWRLLRIRRPDAVQTWMYHADLVGGVLARFAGVRQVSWGIRHSALDSTHSSRSTYWVVKLCAWLSHLVPSHIVCCAQKALDVHRDIGYAARRMLVIRNGYDLTRLTDDPAGRLRLRAELGVGDDWLLGMVGRFDPHKDHRNLFEALALLKRQGLKFCVVLVGCGVDADNIQIAGWLREFGLTNHVCLLGQRTDIPDVMNALDVHVLSSSSEAFPNVVAEAMACGTPAVVTDVGDAALIVGDTGWVVPPRDAPALAAALKLSHDAMLQDSGAWQLRCSAARLRIEEKFGLERMVRQYHAVWAAATCQED